MIICALNQNMLALHFSKILATDDDNKGLNCFHPAFHGKHALAVRILANGGIVLIHDLVTVGSRRLLWACIQLTESGSTGGFISLDLRANAPRDANIPLIVR